MDKATWAFLGSGAGIGAGLMYLLDPQGGKQRRVAARDKAVHACSVSGQAVRKTSVDLANRSRGLVARAGSRLRGNGASDSDSVLAERLRSKLGRWVEHPGAIDVEVNEGRVILRGHALASEVENLLTKAVRVKGIYAVENQLVTHESADGVPELQSSALSKRSALRAVPTLLSFASLPQLPQLQLSQMTPRTRVIAGTAGGALAVAGLVRMLRR